MSLSHFARGAIAAENSRRLIMLRGFTPKPTPPASRWPVWMAWKG